MKTIGTCKECKWWTDMAEIHPELYIKGRQGSCGKIKSSEDGVNVYGDSLPIQTNPDFGCIHWEDKKESENKQENEI